jgi:hypothetical protein
MKFEPRSSSGWRAFQIASLFLCAFALQGATVLLLQDVERPGAAPAPTELFDDVLPTFLVVSTDDDGIGSLRWAIMEANRAGGGLIAFRFSEPGGITFTLRSSLPAISVPMAIGNFSRVITQTFALDGSAVSGNLMTISQTSGVTIERLHFINVREGAAIDAHGVSGVFLRNNTFENSRFGTRFSFSDAISIPFNLFTGIEEQAIMLSDGVEGAAITGNQFEDIGRYAVALEGSPSPVGVLIRDNLFVRTLEPIFLAPGANRDFPAPIIDVISQTLTLRSSADPGEHVYPLLFDIYHVQEGRYIPIGLSIRYPESLFPHPIIISDVFVPQSSPSSSAGEREFLAALATTADGMTSEFSRPEPLSIVHEVAIDIKPGDDLACINTGSRGLTPVAVLGSEVFDVVEIDRASVEFAGAVAHVAGRSGKIGTLEDVNGDGFMDLVLHFSTADLDIGPSDETANLSGRLQNGDLFQGTDAICIVPPSRRAGSATDDAVEFDGVLQQNYPNPFNPTTLIRFQLKEPRHVVVRVFNLLGQEIRVLTDNAYEAGTHLVRWDGTSLDGTHVPSGVYVYTIEAGTHWESKTMVLLR